MKCEICGNKIERIFLNKYNGTTIRDDNGKLHWICSDCQRALNNDKKAIIERLK